MTETDAPQRRPGRVAALGLAAAVLAGCYLIGSAFLVRGQTGVPGHSGTFYDPSRWLLLAALAGAGVAVATTRTRAHAAAAAVVGAATALQLATTGVYAVKHWRPFSGSAGYGHANLVEVVGYAKLVTGTGAVLLLLCLAGAWHFGAFSRAPGSGDRMLALGLGTFVAVTLPTALGVGDGEKMDLTSLGAFALVYALPWGLGLAVTGWLHRAAALAAAGTVLGSAVACLVFHRMTWPANPVIGMSIAVAAAAVVLHRRRTTPRPGVTTPPRAA
ncbi:hypothetical protein [Micromonospora echinofusca]|uniref:Uncharacterized protein n=1 Tax=Micromonospora echinofusca TaxID=47858 RepID=A0ABS3VQU3_MICEH|nr:hypothetical protein [Micromonospora echinofusca]MBO4206904.1 hypothetical protein [Micromonospora echinofusca]